MILDTQKILTVAGNELVNELKNEFDTKGLNFTNDAKNSLSFSATENKLIIEGIARVLLLNEGRLPGTWPDVDELKKWVEGKLNIDEEEVDSVTYLIGRKIFEKGTDILTDKAKGLEIDLLLAKVMNRLHEKLANKIAISVITSTEEAFLLLNKT